jgi:hypothetical protein
MIVAKLSDGRFIVGIDSRNLELLKKERPLRLDMTDYGGSDCILVVYKDTLNEVKKILEQATGSPLPPAQPHPVSKRDH